MAAVMLVAVVVAAVVVGAAMMGRKVGMMRVIDALVMPDTAALAPARTLATPPTA